MAKEPEKPKDMFAPTLPPAASTTAILILTADDVQDLELFYPYYRMLEEGYHVDIASPDGGEIKGKAGWPLKNTLKAADIVPGKYALLYIPGGKAPEKIRKNTKSIELVKKFARSGRPIAAFCHGPQVLVEADLVNGRRISAWPDVAKEIEEAGGTFVNAPLTEDEQFITARWPGDLPGHLLAVLSRLKGERNQRVAV